MSVLIKKDLFPKKNLFLTNTPAQNPRVFNNSLLSYISAISEPVNVVLLVLCECIRTQIPVRFFCIFLCKGGNCYQEKIDAFAQCNVIAVDVFTYVHGYLWYF